MEQFGKSATLRGIDRLVVVWVCVEWVIVVRFLLHPFFCFFVAPLYMHLTSLIIAGMDGTIHAAYFGSLGRVNLDCALFLFLSLGDPYAYIIRAGVGSEISLGA